MRIAMWSGPRNISTALMRAFENRPDTIVCDEPLYAYYLARTGVDHPAARVVVEAGETDWRRVAAALTGAVPEGTRIVYQKHMAHHLLPEVGRDWLRELAHAFLLRDPREMLLSLRRVTPEPELEDTGLPQQVELFEEVRRRSGRVPPVVDARDVLEAPEAMLRLLCDALGIPFSEAMLSWPPGPRASDGVWGPHWYASVYASTGFLPWSPRTGALTGRLADVHARALPYYEALHAHRLRA